MTSPYDLIVAGAGCSGLSFLWHLTHSPLRDLRVLVIDRSHTPSDDKEWCFWGDDLPFQDIACRTWTRLEVGFPGFRSVQDVPDNPYHCVRSIDYETHIYDHLRTFETIDFLEADLEDLIDEDDGATVVTSAGTFHAPLVFQNCLIAPDDRTQPVRYRLRQHFGGWEIRVPEGTVDASVATLMDFDTEQKDGATFFYVLPFTSSTLLVEYTLFSKEVLDRTAYDLALSKYLEAHGITEYTIERREYGVIPMEDRLLSQTWGKHIFNLGSMGGIIKPTTGYAFQRIHKQTQHLVDSMVRTGRPQPKPISSPRYRFYDLLLLRILYDTPAWARPIFDRLFRHNPIDRVLSFIDENTHVGQDLLIFRRLPYGPFLRGIPTLIRNRFTSPAPAPSDPVPA